MALDPVMPAACMSTRSVRANALKAGVFIERRKRCAEKVRVFVFGLGGVWWVIPAAEKLFSHTRVHT